MAEPDNMVLVMLREIRQEIVDARGEAREAVASFDDQRTRLELRVSALEVGTAG